MRPLTEKEQHRAAKIDRALRKARNKAYHMGLMKAAGAINKAIDQLERDRLEAHYMKLDQERKAKP
jgi:pantothenate synthetase